MRCQDEVIDLTITWLESTEIWSFDGQAVLCIIIYLNQKIFNSFYTKKGVNLQTGHNILWYDDEKRIISVIFLEIIRKNRLTP